MTKPLMDTIPTCSRTAAEFLSHFEQATPAEVSQLAERIVGMTQDELALFEYHVLPLCFNENLLSMVCECKELIENSSFLRLSGLLTELFKKQNNLMIEPGVYDRLSASLIDLYPNKRQINVLETLRQIVTTEPGGAKPHRPGPLFDKALAKHIMNAPSRDNAGFIRSMDSLRDVELPKTLEVFIRQRLDAGHLPNIRGFVFELFQLNNLHDSYIEVFRCALGDKTFFDICVEANGSDSCLASALKIIPLAGESLFHYQQFFGKVLKKDQSSLTYLKDFISQDVDDQQVPILTQFMLNNLDFLLGQPKADGKFKLGCVKTAQRHGRGEEALAHLIEGFRAPLSWNDNELKGNLTDMVRCLTNALAQEFPDTVDAQMWKLLHAVVEVVGLETLRKVMPDVDPRFIQHQMDKCQTGMTQMQIMKLFPHIKGPILEDVLGL